MNTIMNKIKGLKNKKGFTLIELLTVVAILGILVLIAAPKFLGYTAQANVATMKADAKVLSTSALVYSADQEIDGVSGAWPVADAPVEVKVDVNKTSGDATDDVIGYAFDETKLKDVKSTKNPIGDYVLVTKDQGKYKAGEVLKKTGVKDKEGNFQYGVTSIVYNADGTVKTPFVAPAP